MPRTATAGASRKLTAEVTLHDQHAQFESERAISLDDIMSMLETVLDGQQEIKEQQQEIIEKLTNLGLERDDYPGYRE